MLRLDRRQWDPGITGHRCAEQFSRRALKKPLGGSIDQRDPPVKPGGDQAAADRVNDVFMQGLQAFQCAARVFELNADLPQLMGEQTRQVRDRKKRKKVDEDNRLQRFQSGMGCSSRKE